MKYIIILTAGLILAGCSFSKKDESKESSSKTNIEERIHKAKHLFESDPKKAIESLESISKENTKNTDVFDQLALLYFRNNQFNEAGDKWEIALKNMEQNPSADIFANYAFYLVEMGQAGFAEPYAEKALKLNPNQEKALNIVGVIELSHENPNIEKALNCFLKSAEVNPNNDVTFNNLGYIHFMFDADLDTAHYFYSKALTINPENTEALNYRTVVNMQLKNYESAFKDATTLLELDSTMTHMYSNLSFIYSGLEQPEKALQYGKKALEIDGEDVSAYSNVGLAYAKLENVDSCCYYFSKVPNPSVEIIPYIQKFCK